jgi:hypothetical protein
MYLARTDDNKKPLESSSGFYIFKPLLAWHWPLSFHPRARRAHAIALPSGAYIAITLARRSFAALNQRDEARKATKNLGRGNVLPHHTIPRFAA